MESGISTQQLDNFNLLPFWKDNESLLKQIEESPTPAKSWLMFKDVSTSQDSNGEHIVTSFDLVNIYGNRKNFFSIIAYLSPDGSSVIREEIIAGNKLSNAKKTVVDGSRITNKDQIEWIKEMSRNSAHRLFRAT
ncbi:MAG TPA: hypothetical protein VF172_04775 [Nitrososphaera sp.]